MKLVMAVVQADEAAKTAEALIEAGFRVTRIATTGGWLRRENATLLSGVEDERVPEMLAVLSRNGVRVERAASGASSQVPDTSIPAGGGIVFVMDVERFEHY